MTKEQMVGQMVHYVTPTWMPFGGGGTRVRPAVIVQAWSETVVNLQVFTDVTNDGQDVPPVYWATSANMAGDCHNLSGHTWHWPQTEA